jgi:hypothetical protein
METFLVILGFAALVGVVYLLQRLLGRGAAAVEGAITGNTRKRGLAAVRLRTEFTAPVPGPQLVARVIETLELGERPVRGLKLGQLSADGSAALIVQGNALATQLQFVLDTDPYGNGCRGFATATRWLESSGQIISTENIERIHKHVRAAVEYCGGRHSETVSA